MWQQHQTPSFSPADIAATAVQPTAGGGGRLGEICVALGKVTGDQLTEALEQQRQTGQRLGDILRARGWLSERDVAEAMAAQLGVSFCDVATATPDTALAALIPAPAAFTYSMLALAQPDSEGTNRAVVAMLNPGDSEALDLFERLTGRSAQPVLAQRDALREALEAVYGTSAPKVKTAGKDCDTVLTEQGGGLPLPLLAAQAAAEAEVSATAGSIKGTEVGGDNSTLERLLVRVVEDALHAGATNIHLEPGEGKVAIRWRERGRLQHICDLPKILQGPLMARIKGLAGLNIAEKRMPQSGRMTLESHNVGGRATATGDAATLLHLRVSTLPNLHGERITLCRIGQQAAAPGLEALGMSPHSRERLAGILARPSGLLLVAGPPDSGRTTTLYTVLESLRQGNPDLNLVTVEDTMQYEISGVSQSTVDEAAGLTYARQIRAALLQDPDVVLVGDLQDPEAVAAACRAATRGPLVLAAIRADDAASAAARLIGMGTPPYLVASALSGIVSQRLVRRLCLACRAEARPTGEETARLGLLPEEPVYGPVGCPECGGTGYKGRIAVHEVLVAGGATRRAVQAGGGAEALRRAAAEDGMIPLAWAAATRVRAGLISPAEAVRVCIG